MSKTDAIVSYDECAERIRTHRIDSIYLLFGDEDLLIEEISDLLVNTVLEESIKSFNLDIVYGSSISGGDILALASSFPMMSDKRVVLVREGEKIASRDQLIPYVQRPVESTILVIVTTKPDFRTKFYQEVRKHATVVECKQLFDAKIPAWITRRVSVMGKRITPDAAELIRTYVSRSLREIQNELDKLFIYVGEAPEITIDDVEQLVGVSRQYNIFELQKCLGRRDLPRSVEILENMLRNGESPVGMIVMLSRYFQKLLALKDPICRSMGEAQLAPFVGVHPAFLNEYQSAARNYSLEELKSCFSTLVDTDTHLKSSTLDAAAAMTLLIYQALSGPHKVENLPLSH